MKEAIIGNYRNDYKGDKRLREDDMISKKKVFIAKAFCVLSVFLLSGCAHLDFGNGKGLTYYDPKPYLFVTISKDCAATATVIMLPGKVEKVKFDSGYGSADFSIGLSNGMITSVNQKTDTKIPETITSLAGLGTAAGNLLKTTMAAPEKPAEKQVYKRTAALYPIENGVPNISAPISFKNAPADR